MSADQLSIVVPNDAPDPPTAPGPARINQQTSETYRPDPTPGPVDPPPAAEVKAYTPAYEPPKDPSPEDEVTRLVPDPNEPITLENGSQVNIKPLRLREFLSMLKIVTRGAAIAMGNIRLDARDEDFMQSMMAMFFLAIPEAEDEAIDFIRIMVIPAGKFEDSEADQERWALESDKLDTYMNSPSLDDTWSVIENIIHREGPDLRRLGKRLMSALEFAQKTAQPSSAEAKPQ